MLPMVVKTLTWLPVFLIFRHSRWSITGICRFWRPTRIVSTINIKPLIGHSPKHSGQRTSDMIKQRWVLTRPTSKPRTKSKPVLKQWPTKTNTEPVVRLPVWAHRWVWASWVDRWACLVVSHRRYQLGPMKPLTSLNATRNKRLARDRCNVHQIFNNSTSQVSETPTDR